LCNLIRADVNWVQRSACLLCGLTYPEIIILYVLDIDSTFFFL
jgi:hypothetical protein